MEPYFGLFISGVLAFPQSVQYMGVHMRERERGREEAGSKGKAQHQGERVEVG